MSKHLRAVREVYGAATDTFVKPDAAVAVLRLIAAAAGCYIEDDDYGSKTSVCVQDGAKFLGFIESATCTADVIASDAGPCADLDREQVGRLLGNMKSHAADWRTMISPDDGSLTFYVDN